MVDAPASELLDGDQINAKILAIIALIDFDGLVRMIAKGVRTCGMQTNVIPGMGLGFLTLI